MNRPIHIVSAGQSGTCDNLNHRRANAPVSHCPKCGGVVNAQLTPTPCDESKHAAARRRQSPFCVDCGAVLVPRR